MPAQIVDRGAYPGVRGARPAVRPPVDPYAAYPTQTFADPNAARTKAQLAVRGLVDPLFAQLATQRANTEGQLGSAYESSAQGLAQALAASGAGVTGAFNTAAQQSAATADAARKALAGEGTAATGDLASKLGQIGASPTNVADLAKTYQGAGASGYSRNLQDTQELLARGADAGSYLAKLPGLARLTANQDLQAALAQARTQFTGQEGQLREEALNRGEQTYGEEMTRAQNALDASYGRNMDVFKLKREDTQAEAARKREDEQAAQASLSAANKQKYDALEAQKERNSQEYLALTALRTQSRNKRQIAELNARIKTNQMRATAITKEQDRLSRESIAATGQTSRETIAAQSSADRRAAIAAQNARDAANRKAADRRAALAAKNTGGKNDDWRTAGSAKRSRIVSSVAGNILVSAKNRVIRANLMQDNEAATHRSIWNRVNASIRAQGINPESPEGKDLRKSIYQTYIIGARTPDGGRYDVPDGWKVGN